MDDDSAFSDAARWAALRPAMTRAELSVGDLFGRYVALGGLASARALAAHVNGGGLIDAREHELARLAVNERFLELDMVERLPYASTDE